MFAALALLYNAGFILGDPAHFRGKPPQFSKAASHCQTAQTIENLKQIHQTAINA